MLDRGKVVLLLLLLLLKLEEVAFLLGKEAGLRLRNNFVQSLRQLEEEAVEQLRQHFRLDSDPLAEHLLRCLYQGVFVAVIVAAHFLDLFTAPLQNSPYLFFVLEVVVLDEESKTLYYLLLLIEVLAHN